jgi:hypothetical protein
MPTTVTTQNSWNSDVPVQVDFGGTGNTTLAQGGVLIGQGTDAVNVTTALTDGQLLIGSTGNDPVPANLSVGDGIAITEGAGTLEIATDFGLEDGELLIGQTGLDPARATLTAGLGIDITNAAGEITIAATGQKPWEVITAATHQMEEDINYVANNDTAKVVFTLPATADVGSVFTVVAAESDGWRIEQGAGQQILIGDKATTEGASGNIESKRAGDSVTAVCFEADNKFIVTSMMGNVQLDAA